MDLNSVLYVTLPLAVMWLLSNRPHQRYLRPRTLAVLGWFAVTGVAGAILPSPAGVLVALAAVVPLTGQQIALRRCGAAFAARDGALLSRRVRTLERWSWPVPLTPHVLTFRVAARELLDLPDEPLDPLASARATPMIALLAARNRGDVVEYERLARRMLARDHGPMEQAAALAALAYFDLDAALRWWAAPGNSRLRAGSPIAAVALLAAGGREAELAKLGAVWLTPASYQAARTEARIVTGHDRHAELAGLRARGSAGERAAARLELVPLRPVPPLSPEAAATLDRLGDGVRNSIHAFGKDRGTWQPRVTWAIAALLSVVFAVQLARGFDDRTLYDMGAFVLGDAPNDWWRAITAAVLHGSVEHFVFNALALLTLGRLAEARVPRGIYVLTWVAASVLSFTLFGVLDRSTLPSLGVGASGGVMGLLGLSLAVFISNQIRVPSAVNQRLLAVFGVLTIVQLVADQFVSNVAWQAHLIGLAVGLLIGSAHALRGRGPAGAGAGGAGAGGAAARPSL